MHGSTLQTDRRCPSRLPADPSRRAAAADCAAAPARPPQSSAAPEPSSSSARRTCCAGVAAPGRPLIVSSSPHASSSSASATRRSAALGVRLVRRRNHLRLEAKLLRLGDHRIEHVHKRKRADDAHRGGAVKLRQRRRLELVRKVENLTPASSSSPAPRHPSPPRSAPSAAAPRRRRRWRARPAGTLCADGVVPNCSTQSAWQTRPASRGEPAPARRGRRASARETAPW
jgi:hypothetical protein